MAPQGLFRVKLGKMVFGLKSKRPRPKKKLKMLRYSGKLHLNILLHTPMHTQTIKVYPEELFEYTQMNFYEDVGDRKNEKLPREQQSFFMTMFHCFYNKTDYAETRAGGLTAGCSGPLRVI